MSSEPKQAGKRKRRWYQFSLRTLMLGTLVVGCGLGPIADERQKVAKQRAVVEASQLGA